MTDNATRLSDLNDDLEALMGDTPELEAFMGYVQSAEEPAALDAKTKELMSLAIGVVIRCEPCILWHTDGAVEAGATREEIADALKVAVVMGGGPALAYASEAYQVAAEFLD